MSGGKDPQSDPQTMRDLVKRYRVTSGEGFDIDRFASDDLPTHAPDKQEAKAILQEGIARMAALQERLYANATYALLIIVQAVDAAGKDSTIKHVMTGINPQGVVVTSFKAPGPHELAHDFLWRIHGAAPARGMIGIFNRSHYETWKFSAADIEERQHWDSYRAAYQAAIAATATKGTPWFVVPADRKWFARLIVAEAIIAALEDLALENPTLSDEERVKLAAARRTLEGR